MKKRYIFLCLSAIYITILVIIKLPKTIDGAVNEALDKNKPFLHAYNTCDIAYKAKKYQEAGECFEKLLKDHDRNDIRYNYAACLAQTKQYDKSKKELEYIIENEKTHNDIIEAAKDLNTQIDNILHALRNQANSLQDVEDNNIDAGDYFSEIKDKIRWQKPENITVYIEDDPKRNLFVKAFGQWNGALGGAVYFNLVTFKNANIVCSFSNLLKEDEGGITDWYYYEEEGQKYLQKATIQVSKFSLRDKKEYTDAQLYSIMLHEIGHALGISEHSPFKGDIMYFSTDSFLNEKGRISNRDINTVKKIYKK